MRIITILLCFSLIAPNAIADCESTLEACDKAVETCKKAKEAKDGALQLCNLALTESIDEVARLNGVVDERNEQLDAWYRNPFIMGILGVAAGIVIIEVAK